LSVVLFRNSTGTLLNRTDQYFYPRICFIHNNLPT